ncbi:gamma-glutamylcyclotransferase [Paracoccus luteus]|uniref:gamma-glutamylcyclotransferase n=1 Tax=Paracoccus luteus TaxID=2508543 RepID=UPI00106FB5C0|nr:gamma-glutamylcyclotransferase [Paracoccus luteus]
MTDDLPFRAALALTPDHVARAHREVAEPPYDAGWTLLTDDELDALADQLTTGRPRPVPIFAYGSLIWNPGFAVGATRLATAPDWHRSFCIHLNHWRGSPDCPGLMLALEPGGSCTGLVMEIAAGTEQDSLRAILRRELVAHELVANACWITVDTDRGREQALTFYAGTVGQTLVHLPVQKQAMRLAHACGHAGSGAEYLHRTAEALAAHGLHDPYVWQLQQLVAAEIDRWPRRGAPIGDV